MSSDLGPVARRYELFLALRYLKARRKQAFTSVVSAVSILGITVGVSALVIALALLTGFQEDIQSKIIGANAHITVFGPGAQPISDYRDVLAIAQETPGVVAASATVLQYGMLTTGFDPAPVTLKGIDPSESEPATDLVDRLIKGRAEDLPRDSRRARAVTGALGDDGSEADSGAGHRESGAVSSRPGIILGADLAQRLLVTIGDPVRLVVLANQLTPLGGWGPRWRTFDVVGIFEAGMYEYDNAWALVDMAELQQLFAMGDTASHIEIRVENFHQTEPVMAALRERLGDQFYTSDWKQMNRFFFAALNLEKLAMFVTISLIVFVAALNIVATLVLMVMEKNRDIGILLSMGATRKAVLYTFMLQGLMIGLAGTATGLVLGVALSYVADTYRLVSLPEQVYYLSYVPFVVRPLDFTAVALLAVGISFVATVYPAWRASRLDPVEALRYE